MTAARYHPGQVSVSGGDLRVGRWEPESTPAGTLLAIHGITANHRAWSFLAEALPEWGIIAPDLRGRGRSNALPGPYGMAAHADDMAAVITESGQGPLLVVGHSMGAFVALVLADRHPELVSRLVLLDGGIPVELPPDIDAEVALQAVLGPAAERLRMEFPTVGAYHEFWQQHPALAEVWGPDLADYAAYDLEGEPPHLRPSTRVEAMTEDSRDLQTGQALLSALGGLRHPAVFLRAERGLLNQPAGLYSTAWVEQWVARLPGVRMQEAPGTNHYTLVMSPRGAARVAAAIA